MSDRPPPPQPASASRGSDKTRWDRATILVPWMLSIVTVLIGIWQFSETQNNAVATRRVTNATLDAANRKPFLEKQLAIAFEAADDAAILATTTDEAEWRKARRSFARLHYGQLRIVEDRTLEAAMSRFMEQLPPENYAGRKLPMSHLEPLALEISEATRQVVAKSWAIDLSPLGRAPGGG